MARHRTWVEIDEVALRANIDSIRSRLSKGARFCATVKANAYGHGQEAIVQACMRAGVDAFGVDSIDDAIQIKAAHPELLVICLGYVMTDRFPEAIEAGVELTVYDQQVIQELDHAAAACEALARVHLKVDTGTSRQGVLPEHMTDVLDEVARSSRVELSGVSMHFANVEDADDSSYATLQAERFSEACERIIGYGFSPEWVHCACSAATILYPETHGSLARVGISLYGIWSSDQTERAAREQQIDVKLTPVLSWKSRIAQVKSLPAGTPIGYGLTERLQKRSRIAVVPVGYWDGLDRKLSSVGEMLVNGHRCKVMGRVCMNMCMIDVSKVPNLEREEEVVIIGRSGRHHVAAEELAEHIGTIAYEVVTRINPEIPRRLV